MRESGEALALIDPLLEADYQFQRAAGLYKVEVGLVARLVVVCLQDRCMPTSMRPDPKETSRPRSELCL